MRRILAIVSVAALMVMLVATPALAQPRQSGLVNVELTDVLSGNQVNVQVPIGVAANVCGVQANVLAQGGLQEPVDCTSSTTADLPVAFRP
jgi:ChpA-C